jgi:Domain of unknown function (DUF5655)
MSLAEYFSTGPAYERRIHDAVLAHLQPLDDVHVEYVSVGVFFKRSHTFAELRPMRNRVRLSVLLSRRVQHPRIVRKYEGHGARNAYWIDLHDADDVDAEVRDWLTEACLSSPT